MGDRNHPAGSIELPKLVDILGDGSKIVFYHSNLLYVQTVASELTESEFKRLEDSPLNPIVKLGMRKGIRFSGKLFQCLMQRRVELKGNMTWFTFAWQPMRFSEREFLLTTGLPFVVEENVAPLDLPRVETTYSWMESGKTLKDLIALLQDKKIKRTECEKLSLASLILVEGIILGLNTIKLIPTSSLQEALNFEDYIRKSWGEIGFDFLRTNILKMSVNSWTKKTHGFEGFGWAINFLALCSVPHPCIIFGKQDETATTSEYPLMLRGSGRFILFSKYNT